MHISVERLFKKDNPSEKYFLAAIFFIIAFIYFYDILNYWFFYDDPAAIASSTDSIKEIFLTNNYSYAFYTPLVALSFKPDVMLFGMNPLPYHVHNLIVLVFIAFMVYLISRRYTDLPSSFLSATIVLLSAPSLVCLIWITLRQYLYSMLFSLVATYLFLRYKPEPKQNTFIVLIVLILSELSFMGKEQFMTLPLILFILSDGGFRQRVYKTYPYFLLLALHLLLRWQVLGGMGGYFAINYQPKVYLRTTIESILTTSKILFGFPWLIIAVALPSLLRTKGIIMAVLIWLAALSVSFLQMFFYPSADVYRYWFIPVVLFSFFIGFNASFIKNGLLKILFLLVIMAFFLSNSLKINKNLKNFFKKETIVAKQVSMSMIDGKYRDNIILIPANRYIEGSSYPYTLAKAYYKILGIESFPAFYPVEFLAFYPDITKDFKGIHEIREGAIVDITNSIEDRINRFEAVITNEKPEIKLLKTDYRKEIIFKCRSGETISVYLIQSVARKYFINKVIIPYLERIDLNPFTMSKADVKLIPIGDIFYYRREWYVGEDLIPNNATLMMGSCTNSQEKSTLLSDAVYVSEPIR